MNMKADVTRRTLLDVQDLHTVFEKDGNEVHAVNQVSFDVKEGEILAIVGESGSGKSITAMSLLRLIPSPPGRIVGGRVLFNDQDLLDLDDEQIRRLRGRDIAMIFQEPMTSLNPSLRIGRQLAEPLRVHGSVPKEKVRERCLELLRQVRLGDPEKRLDAYPHELSGGMRQRVMIAMGLACLPKLLIADEPTTALDVTIQETILDLLRRLQRERNLGILLISHDLGLVARYADDVAVMHQGRIVETGATARVLEQPEHDYTRHLLAAEPAGHPEPLTDEAPELLNAQGLSVHFKGPRRGWFGRAAPLAAVDDLSLTLRRGETLGVVGESGSGKSTLALALLRLIPAAGTVRLLDQPLDRLSGAALRPWRRHMQVVFQDPFGSLNPRLSVGRAVDEGLRVHHKDLNAAQRAERTRALLEEVGLPADAAERYPHEFSGGQRQRIAIARALIVEPDLLILDEPTSALDRSVQAQVLELLKTLQRRHGLSYLFISHDLKVVRAISHRLLVMRHGQVVEHGDTERVFREPQQAYTRRLIDAAYNRTVNAGGEKQAVAH